MVGEDKEPADPLMEQARLYIQQNAYKDMSMMVLADELGISPVQLTRRFTRSLGMTPSRYLSHIRLEQAKSLLVDTHLNLEQNRIGLRLQQWLLPQPRVHEADESQSFRLPENESSLMPALDVRCRR